MLEGFKRWFGSAPAPVAGWESLAPWAQARHCTFRGVKDSDGFIVEGRLGTLPWRLEWGPSQREYIEGSELRLRSELALPSDLQVVVLSRRLQEQLERDVFDQYIEGVQTRIDTETPPEMRWLVMFPKLAGTELGVLKDGFAALGSIKPWLQSWLEGDLAHALHGLALKPDRPLVLMIGRGRLTLRTALETPDAAELERLVALFEVAMREARRAATQTFDITSPSTQPSLWTASGMPGSEDRK